MKTVKLIFLFILMIVITVSALVVPVDASSTILGDADGDGEVCITDATMIQRDVAQIIKIEEGFRRSADVDSDGIITIMDATATGVVLDIVVAVEVVGDIVGVLAAENIAYEVGNHLAGRFFIGAVLFERAFDLSVA